MANVYLSEIQDSIANESQLEDLLSEPTEGVVETMRRLEGDLLILGVGGKMGPTLARMARRASDEAGVPRRIIGVARFTEPLIRDRLELQGIETIQADLMSPGILESLPEAANVLFMAAMKFGTSGQESRTWAVNCFLPGLVARRFATSRIVAFSTGNVYPLMPVSRGGSSETEPPKPFGEYAMSCLGRERLFEYGSQEFGTPVSLIRLNYAAEMRYGVLVDIARKVLSRTPIDLSMGYFNVIWQGDANAMTLRSFDLVASPPRVLNVTGSQILSVRSIAERFGELFGVAVTFCGREAEDALLSDSRFAQELFGPCRVDPDRMVIWIADWLRRDGSTYGKPTRFEVRDGRF